jgi:hypothetical protein
LLFKPPPQPDPSHQLTGVSPMLQEVVPTM